MFQKHICKLKVHFDFFELKNFFAVKTYWFELSLCERIPNSTKINIVLECRCMVAIKRFGFA